MDTPVALFIFRRPETTARVFAEIARARPSKLLIIADGPSPSRPGEAERCAATRAIVEQVDWPCSVLRNYADTNLGLRARVASGLDWVFSQVDEAIILEDDCLPHPTFFGYCRELLDRYRHAPHIMHIAGSNFLPPSLTPSTSYYFSRYPLIWGWATWARAWQHYDLNLTLLDDAQQRRAFLRQLTDWRERRFWERTLTRIRRGALNTWDYQWSLTCRLRQGLAINPSRNLVINIGIGPDAHHTQTTIQGMPHTHEAIPFPLVHPADRTPIPAIEAHMRETYFSTPTLAQMIRNKLQQILPRAS